MTMKKTDAEPAFEVKLEKIIDAPRERVWKAWSQPEEIKRWFAPEPYRLGVETMEFRAGGVFRMTMTSPAGETHAFSGVYREVTPFEKIVWTGRFPYGPEDQIRTEILFDDLGGKTKVRVRQTFSTLTPETEAHAKGARQGWTMTLDQLAEHASS